LHTASLQEMRLDSRNAHIVLDSYAITASDIYYNGLLERINSGTFG
jgi:hypothetical protein